MHGRININNFEPFAFRRGKGHAVHNAAAVYKNPLLLGSLLSRGSRPGIASQGSLYQRHIARCFRRASSWMCKASFQGKAEFGALRLYPKSSCTAGCRCVALGSLLTSNSPTQKLRKAFNQNCAMQVARISLDPWQSSGSGKFLNLSVQCGGRDKMCPFCATRFPTPKLWHSAQDFEDMALKNQPL